MNAIETPVRRKAAKRGGGKMSREEACYWGLWREIFAKFGVPQAEQAQWRRDLRRQLLGSDRTQATFTHADYDLVLGAMREMLSQASLAVFPEKIIEAYELGERRRIIYLIDELDMPEAYVAKISRGKFGAANWRSMLFACELKHLFYTLSARKRAAAKKDKHYCGDCPF